MKRLPPILSACVASLLAPCLAGQTPAPKADAAGPERDDWFTPTLSPAELDRAFAEYSRKVDALSASVGSARPLRADDPAFPSPAAWRDAVRGAPRLNAAQVLAQLERPRLRVRWTDAVRELYRPQTSDAYLDIVKALEAHGRRSDHASGLALEISLGSASGNVSTLRGGREVGRADYAMLHVEARFLLPVRVLRGDQPHSGMAVIARGQALRATAPRLTRADLLPAIQEAVAQAYAQASSLSSAPAAPRDLWSSWLADAAQAPARQEAFARSHQPAEARLAPPLSLIADFRGVSAQLVNRSALRNTFFVLTDAELGQRWLPRLHAAGREARLPSGPELRHEITFTALRSPMSGEDAVAWISRPAVHDDDCLAVVGDRFVRVAGDTYTLDASFGLLISDRAANRVRATADASIDAFLRALLTGPAGTTATIRHAHADAVATYLRGRQLVPVPDAAMADISHRIAVAFANAPGIPDSAQREFLVETQGRRIYDLARIGTMRQGSLTSRPVKDAINRVIQDLTFADPVGLAAFNDVWNHDRGYRPPEIPAEFVQRLSRPRPSGAGALCAERLITAFELAYRRVNALESRQQNELRARLAPLRTELGEIKLLACDYLPADGRMNYVETRSFLYRAKPKGWDDLLARLPPELTFARIGPPLPGGPDTLAEADRRIAAP